MSSSSDKVISLQEYRKQRNKLVLRVGDYYFNPQFNLHIHVAGISEPLYTRFHETFFIIEDTLGNVSVFSSQDDLEGFVFSSEEDFLAALSEGIVPDQ